MRKSIMYFVFFVSIIIVSLIAISYSNERPTATLLGEKFKADFIKDISNLEVKADSLYINTGNLKDSADLASLKNSFFETIKEYRKIEFKVAYFNPLSAEKINSCTETTVEILSNKEPLKFKREILNEVRCIRANIKRLKAFSYILDATDKDILEVNGIQNNSSLATHK